MHRIYTDHRTTRRQRLHYVTDGEDTVCFTSKDLDACLAWLRENGHNQAELIGRDSQYSIKFKLLAEREIAADETFAAD